MGWVVIINWRINKLATDHTFHNAQILNAHVSFSNDLVAQRSARCRFIWILRFALSTETETKNRDYSIVVGHEHVCVDEVSSRPREKKIGNVLKNVSQTLLDRIVNANGRSSNKQNISEQ